jgi:Xaa-Pro aminopeptidase
MGQASQQCKGFEIIEHNNEKSIYQIINSLGIKQLSFEEDFVTYGQYKELEDKLTGISLSPLNGIVNKLRRYKDSEELSIIEKAAIITDEAFGYIIEYIKPGISEKEISFELENCMRKKGASGTSFNIIVASGIRSAMPHGVASDKLVEKGDFITMDFGCVYQGYCSDMTRTIVIGKATEKQREIYNIVLEAQQKALEAIKPGISTKEVDRVARNVISTYGYGKYFGHGLGHGVGLEIHEEPRLSPLGKDILEAGMVITNEPGIYIPDFGGVRIEDLVVVTHDGNKVLSKSPKQLIEL